MNACETHAAIVVRTLQAATDACVQLVIESLEQNVAEVCSGLKSVKINVKAIYFFTSHRFQSNQRHTKVDFFFLLLLQICLIIASNPC